MSFVFKKPQTFAAWLTLTMLKHGITDEEMANHICMKEMTLTNWKGNKNLPKMKGLFKMLDYISIRSGESPVDLLDEALDSIYWYREINAKYRKRIQEEQNK